MASPEPSPGPPHDEAEWRALAAIAQGRRAWSRTADLVAAGIDPATLDALVRKGLATWWRPRRRADAEGWARCVALTPWGTSVARREVAERWAKVEAEEHEGTKGGLCEVPYYGPLPPPPDLKIRPRRFKLPRRRNEFALPVPADVISESMGPDEEAMAREEIEYIMETKYDEVTGEEQVKPVVIMGVKVRRDYRMPKPPKNEGR
jgi:hypothetical protein